MGQVSSGVRPRLEPGEAKRALPPPFQGDFPRISDCISQKAGQGFSPYSGYTLMLEQASGLPEEDPGSSPSTYTAAHNVQCLLLNQVPMLSEQGRKRFAKEYIIPRQKKVKISRAQSPPN
ncbi:hypothetical protein STEG23_030999 [Scotinomys teguina]